MSNSERVYQIDALRGFAALFVVLYHFGIYLGFEEFTFGSLGVDLFFIISGYVYSISIKNGTNTKKFVIGRFIRLYPAYWASLFLFLLLSFWGSSSIINKSIYWDLFRIFIV